MRYILRQKMISLGTDFTVKDENGKDKYFIDGYAFSIGKKFSFQDMQKKQLALIKQKLFTFSPTYKIESSNGGVAFVKKALFSFRHKFILDVPGPNDFTVVGRLIEHEYNFYRDGRVVATVSKKYLKATDTYTVDIESGNQIFILSAAIAIDMICHNRQSKHDR